MDLLTDRGSCAYNVKWGRAREALARKSAKTGPRHTQEDVSAGIGLPIGKPHSRYMRKSPDRFRFWEDIPPTQYVRLDEDTLLQRQSVVAIYS